jgi:ABC-type polysaccharide/polyol phosphate export permease
VEQRTATLLVNTPRRPGVLAALRELWRYRGLVLELSRRALQLRYKNSVLGVAWSLANPLMLIFLITIMRKLFIGEAIPNYSAYIFPAMFAWAFFNASIPEMCTALLDNAPLLRRVYFPRELLPLTVLLANCFHLVLAMVLTLLYLAVHRIFPQQVGAQVLLILLVIPAQLLLTLGIGLTVSSLNVLFEDIKYIVTMTMQLLMYAVPIIYPIEKVWAAQQHHDWGLPLLNTVLGEHLLNLYLLNPFANIIVLFQKALLPPIQVPDIAALPFSWGWLGVLWLQALIVLALGLWVFDRYNWSVVERL